jgi:hypothetical protein
MEITLQGVSRSVRAALLVAMFLAALPIIQPARAAVLLDDFTVTLFDQFPRNTYVAEVGFEVDPRTPIDDEVLFGRGDVIDAPGPWTFSRYSPASFSAFSNADDAHFEAVVARLTDGIDEQFSVLFYRITSSGCCFGSGYVYRRLESEWFDVAGLAGATIDEIRFDWAPTPDGPIGPSGTQLGTATISLYAVPEPATGALLGVGLLVLTGSSRLRHRGCSGGDSFQHQTTSQRIRSSTSPHLG